MVEESEYIFDIFGVNMMPSKKDKKERRNRGDSKGRKYRNKKKLWRDDHD